MRTVVRRACCESESQQLIDTLQTNLPHLQHAQLFPWLYLLNPEGQAKVWVATETETQRVIGMAAAFPRRVYCRGEEVRGYVFGDFCVDPNHRSLGLALMLQRACVEGVSDDRIGYAFDFPSRTMMAVYKRMQLEANAIMVRYAKPLRVDRQMDARIPAPAIARGLSTVLNAGLKLRDQAQQRTGALTIANDTGPWGEDFTEAARQWSQSTGVCVLRTADYLNWRYRQHPTQSYEMLTARQGDKLRGYLIFHMTGEDCTIDDLMADNNETRSALLAEAAGLGHARHVHTISMPWLSGHPGTQLLEQCGFRARETSPVVVLALTRPAQNQPATDWFLTSGDWES